MLKRGKNYRAGKEKKEDRPYKLEEAIAFIKTNSFANFDETLEMAFRLGVDFKKSDQSVRGTVNLPHGTGKKMRVLVFAKGAAQDAARKAGAESVGLEDLIEKIKKGWMDFDVAIATPDVMPEVRKLGKFLGPRGLMPSPKAGTVTDDISSTIGQFKGGRIEFRMDRHGNVTAPFGKRSFDAAKLVENGACLMNAVINAKPHSSKGVYIKRCTVSSTMGVGLQLDLADVIK